MSDEIKNAAAAGKKPVSEARRRANVENARRSTGPRAAGKSISRYNRLIHGLRADTILPGEDEMYQALLAAHIDELGAESPLERMYIERAVMATLKLLRGDRVECALADRLMTAAAAGTTERDAADLERLKTQIAVDPAGTVRQLRKSVAGCLWIQQCWFVLKTRITNYISMLPTQRTLSVNLLGKHMSDLYGDDSEVTRWVVAHLGTLFGGEKDLEAARVIDNTGKPKAGMSPKELEVRVAAVIKSIPDAEQARAQLLGYIAEELAKLKEHIALVTEVAEHRRACDVQAAEIALNAEGKQLLGYVTTHRQSYDAALRRHDALRNPRRPGPRRGPGPGSDSGSCPETARGQTESQAPAATVPTDTDDRVEAPAAVAPGAEAAVGIEAACSGCASPDEATPESLPLTEAEGTDEPALEAEGESLAADSPGPGDPMMDPEDASFFTTEPNLADEPPIEPADETLFTTEANRSDEPPIEPADEPFFTTEGNRSDEPPIELEGPRPGPGFSGPGGWTPEEAARYRAARIAAAKLPPLDPEVVAATERIGKRIDESVHVRSKERLDKILAELDAKEARERAEFAASIQAKYGWPLPAAVPKDAMNPDAPRAPPAGARRRGEIEGRTPAAW